ncbi:uncharacterized protein LOC134529509 [Bacillus rossius redtenbacheri]|uniref:uncharacterized protein LOC134529509 n=1 Tax=Bacillus rossius redtenbacheri TaxID=93214 RepID=UPI002FDDDE7F
MSHLLLAKLMGLLPSSVLPLLSELPDTTIADDPSPLLLSYRCSHWDDAMCMLPLRSLGLQFEKDVPVLSREVRSTLFPESSSMGLFLAVGIPLDEPYNDVSFSWNYEANYVLPYNASELSQYGYARRETRSLRDLSRTTAYLVLRHKFQSHGYDGETCLLKAICEAAATPMKGTSMIADILHVVFTPSTSVNEDLGPEYQLAENRGRSGEDCEEVYEDCPISLVQLISEIDD